MLFQHDDTTNFQYQGNNPFDPEAEWARSTEFQRHTLRLNGIWRMPWGRQPVGRLPVRLGQLLRDHFAANPFGHGTAPNALRHRADRPCPDGRARIASTARRRSPSATSFRVTRFGAARCTASTCGCRRTSTCRGGMRLTGIAEVFNLFNHENYGAYNGQVNSTDLRGAAPEPVERVSAARDAAGVQSVVLRRVGPGKQVRYAVSGPRLDRQSADVRRARSPHRPPAAISASAPPCPLGTVTGQQSPVTVRRFPGR